MKNRAARGRRTARNAREAKWNAQDGNPSSEFVNGLDAARAASPVKQARNRGTFEADVIPRSGADVASHADKMSALRCTGGGTLA